MKKIVIAVLFISILACSASAFADKKRGPGDGGFFTKFFNGVLGDSWTKSPSSDTGTTGSMK